MTERISREHAIAFVIALQQAANAHDARRLGDFYTEDAVAFSPVLGEIRGREAVVRSWETLFTKFPDSAMEVSDIFTDGERIVYLGTMRATDTGGWFGLPPTGTCFHYRETLLCTIRGGRIAREERIYDTSAVVERLEKARLDQELRVAADVQSALLSRIADEGRHWEAAADSIACRAIGGDFFEIVELESGALGVALGDVEGKGMPAALVAAMLHGMFAADARSGLSPSTTLARMSRQLAARHEGPRDLVTRSPGSRFATFVYGVLSADGRFVYANAGHNHPALLTEGGVERLGAGGPVLGAFAHATYEESEVRFAPGDALVMFSDGVTEARNAGDEELGEERLLDLARQGGPASPTEMLGRIFAGVRAFVGDTPQGDDITATVTRYR
jgi:serine phosphatase RsbU (regulator of sigma subunit)